MAKFQLTSPKGAVYEFEAPDGASEEQLVQVARQYIDQAEPDNHYRDPVHLNNAPPASDAPPTVPQGDQRPESFLTGVGEGVMKPINNAARVLDWGADKIGVDLDAVGEKMGLPSFDQAIENQQAHFDELPTKGSDLGKGVGEVVGTLPVLAAPGGALTQGAMSGALITDKRDPLGIATDAAIGAAAGKAGEVALNTVAKVASPAVSDALKLLRKEGVEVTPGLASRSNNPASYLARQEDKAVSQPWVGDVIVADRSRTGRQFATAAVQRSLTPIGEKLPAEVQHGRAAVKYAGDKLSGAYDDVLPRIGKFAPDQQFVDDLAVIQEEANDMLPARAEQLDKILKGLGRYFGDDGASLDGAGLKAIERRLGGNVRRFSASADADQQQLGEVLDIARSAIRDAAGRAFPAEAERLAAINQGWASLTQVERAAGNADGVITPAGYSQAVKASDASVRRRGYARGEALNQDLADAASDVLPSDIANSGSGERLSDTFFGNVQGASKMLPYLAAKKALPFTTREAGMAGKTISALARHGSKTVSVAAPSVVEALRHRGP